MAQVISKKGIRVVSDPLKREVDPWAAFREVEQVTLELTQHYTHSFGKYSRFFIELENKRFLATRCKRCNNVFAPPRPLCPNCLTVTDWVELPGTGMLVTYSVLHFSPGSNPDVDQLRTPYIFAYVLLDGASTLFPHILVADPAIVTLGMRVKIHYVEQPVSHPIHLIRFIPLEP
jgi:uncharacterized OB-fold protein